MLIEETRLDLGEVVDGMCRRMVDEGRKISSRAVIVAIEESWESGRCRDCRRTGSSPGLEGAMPRVEMEVAKSRLSFKINKHGLF
jgi:hypothetical protein